MDSDAGTKIRVIQFRAELIARRRIAHCLFSSLLWIPRVTDGRMDPYTAAQALAHVIFQIGLCSRHRRAMRQC